MGGEVEPAQLPDDPTLAAWASALNGAGQWAEILDARWRATYMTDDARLLYGGGELAPYPVGAHTYGPEMVETRIAWAGGQWPLEINRQAFSLFGPFLLADTPGGRDELRELVDPRLRDLVDDLAPADDAAATIPFRGLYSGAGHGIDVLVTVLPVRAAGGDVVGTVFLTKPAVRMATLTRMTAMGDVGHFNRMDQVARPGRRPAALLFGDLEASTRLSRRLSTADYFTVGRRIVRAADQCVIDGGGLVGRHVGDGIVGFFLAETAGSETAAARSCIDAARRIRVALADVAARSELAPEDLRMRFGLHWGARIYVGQIATAGRNEVNALGDEVNETARIETCAAGGRTLASKELLERLDRTDILALDIDPTHIRYTQLADLDTVTSKASRDAPSIAVCDITDLVA